MDDERSDSDWGSGGAGRRPSDGGRADPGIDEDRLYRIVHDAVEDAVLGAVGTILLVGVAFVLVWTGVAVVLQNESPAGAVLGGSAIVVGVYLAAASLKVIPPAREWV